MLCLDAEHRSRRLARSHVREVLSEYTFCLAETGNVVVDGFSQQLAGFHKCAILDAAFVLIGHIDLRAIWIQGSIAQFAKLRGAQCPRPFCLAYPIHLDLSERPSLGRGG